MMQCPEKPKNEWQQRQESFTKALISFDFSVEPVPLLYSKLMKKTCSFDEGAEIERAVATYK